MEDEKKPCIYQQSCLFPECDPTKCKVYTPKEQGMEFYRRQEPSQTPTLHKLIKADELASQISWYNHHECGGISVSDVMRYLYNAPAVDAVEVVRCENCGHSKRWGNEGTLLCYRDETTVHIVKPDGYCDGSQRRYAADAPEVLKFAPVVHTRFVDGVCTNCGWFGDCVETPHYKFCPERGATTALKED